MGKRFDLTGHRFTRLTAVQKVACGRCGRSPIWECLCDCGNTVYVDSGNLRSGHTQSCGCLQKEKARLGQLKHDGKGTRLYTIWNDIRLRCNNKKNRRYSDYGGRGIKVCTEWDSFITFKDWALSNGYSDGLSIDRINNDRGYFPDNCKWSTSKEQANNRRSNQLITYNGKTQNITQWSEETGINVDKLYARIKYLKWSIERALTTA